MSVIETFDYWFENKLTDAQQEKLLEHIIKTKCNPIFEGFHAGPTGTIIRKGLFAGPVGNIKVCPYCGK